MPRPNKPNASNIGMWTAFRDIAVFSMRKGQLPILGIFVLVGLVLYKTPNDYFPTLWAKLFELKGFLLTVSSIGNVALLVGWAVHLRIQRRWFKEESERIINVRNDLQQGQIGKIESSNP